MLVTGISRLSTGWFEFCLKEHIAPGLEESTVEWYRYLIEHYILPAIGEAQLDAGQAIT
jgi:hypothetical protein